MDLIPELLHDFLIVCVMKRPDDCRSSFWPLNLDLWEEATEKKSSLKLKLTLESKPHEIKWMKYSSTGEDEHSLVFSNFIPHA